MSKPSGSPSASNAPDPFEDPLERSILNVCNAVGDVIAYWGFKHVQGRVWTYVALSNRPRAQVEVAEALQVSKSLVSLTMSELTELNLVRATGPQRGAPYEATLDIWPVVSDVLRSREWMLLESARLALISAREELQLSGDGTADFKLDNVKLLLTMVEVAQSVLHTIMTIRNPEPAAVTQSWVQRASSLLSSFRRRST